MQQKNGGKSIENFFNTQYFYRYLRYKKKLNTGEVL